MKEEYNYRQALVLRGRGWKDTITLQGHTVNSWYMIEVISHFTFWIIYKELLYTWSFFLVLQKE